MINIGCDKILVKDECKQLIQKCRKAMNKDRNYIAAYDYSVEAKFLAVKVLDDYLLYFESEMLRGLSYLGIDKMIGHDIISDLYYESIEKKLILENILKIRINKAMGYAKRYIGEYDEAIRFFMDALGLAQRKLELEIDLIKKEDVVRLIIETYINVAVSLIYKYKQRNHRINMKRLENRLKEKQIDGEQINRELNQIQITTEIFDELVEAKRYIDEALKMSENFQFTELEITCKLNYAYILVEKEEYHEALKILTMIKNKKFIIENAIGHVWNEIAIIYINTGKFELGIELLQKAWNWLYEKNELDELNRNLYGSALYYFKMDNLDMAYAFAELAFSRDQDIDCLKLLYEITLFKYLQSLRYGDESEYVFYRSEYEKYRNNLERRT